MTRKICCNPLKHHKKQYLKDLNPVSATAISTGLVNEGDLICSGCRKKLFEKLKPKKTVENSECDSSCAAPQQMKRLPPTFNQMKRLPMRFNHQMKWPLPTFNHQMEWPLPTFSHQMEKSPFLNPRSQQRSSLFMRVPFLRNRWMKMMFSQLQIVRSQPLAKAQ